MSVKYCAAHFKYNTSMSLLPLISCGNASWRIFWQSFEEKSCFEGPCFKIERYSILILAVLTFRYNVWLFFLGCIKVFTDKLYTRVIFHIKLYWGYNLLTKQTKDRKKINKLFKWQIKTHSISWRTIFDVPVWCLHNVNVWKYDFCINVTSINWH